MIRSGGDFYSRLPVKTSRVRTGSESTAKISIERSVIANVTVTGAQGWGKIIGRVEEIDGTPGASQVQLLPLQDQTRRTATDPDLQVAT